MSYYEIEGAINNFCIKQIIFHPFFYHKLKAQSYAKWALCEILERAETEKERSSSIDIFRIVDDFIRLMDEMLSIKFFSGFNTARRTAIILKQYLIGKII